MNLYHLSQTETTDYDTFDQCVVAAASEADSRLLHPMSTKPWWTEAWFNDGKMPNLWRGKRCADGTIIGNGMGATLDGHPFPTT